MIKRIITLVVTSSAISAGLLYLGITMMRQYSPALATSENALVAGTNTQKSQNDIPTVNDIPLVNVPVASGNVQNSTNPNLVVGNLPLTKNPGGENQKLEVSSNQTSISSFPVSSSQPLTVPVSPDSGVTPIIGMTIAQLLKSQEQYLDKIFALTGIATSLSDDKFLLNDGTGQILVEKDDMVSFAIMSGMSITVIGKLEESNSPTGFELDAYTLTDQNGKVANDDDMDDDSGTDDMDDGDMDDENSDEDTDDDSSDDDMDDDDSNGDSDDDSGDDENDTETDDDSCDDGNDNDSGDDSEDD